MAGTGFAPKDPSQRRNKTAPARGDWIDLPVENPTPAPKMPKPTNGRWAAGTKTAWLAWWRDPASLTWGPADVEAVRQLAYLLDEMECGKLSLAGEIRLRTAELGLSQKGKRDLRLRVVSDPEELTGEPVAPKERRLKVV